MILLLNKDLIYSGVVVYISYLERLANLCVYLKKYEKSNK